jgi:hypothetical protein
MKFTIRERTLEGEKLYYAQAVNIEQDPYKNLPNDQKDSYYGTEINDSKHRCIYYRDPMRLLNDILAKYGKEGLRSER